MAIVKGDFVKVTKGEMKGEVGAVIDKNGESVNIQLDFGIILTIEIDSVELV